MILRITEEASRGAKDGNSTVFYLREVPHEPGKGIQATALTLESAQWLASRIDGVTKLELPKNNTTG